MLRGLAGGAAVALALPALEAMLDPHGEKLASGAPLPRRFMTWFFGNGVLLNRWVPEAQGPAWELTPELAPLAPVREYCSILSGFDNRAGYGRRGHHDGVAGCFSGHPFIELPPSGVYSSKFGGPSIDQVAAQAIGGQTYLASLELGVSRRVSTDQGPTLQFLSHKGPDQPAPPLYDPQKVFAKLFGMAAPAQDPTTKLRLGVLDAVHEDAKRLRLRVGKADQARLDAHLTSIEQLEKQIQAVAPACAAPPLPGVANVEDESGHEPLQAISELMADLLGIAFACDLTRVASFMQSGGFGSTLYWMTGATIEEHSLTHMPGQEELVHQAIVFNMECFAYLLSRLKATPEGSGNVLDNCCIFLGSDCSEGATHGCFDQPIIVAGRGGGALQFPGIHYRSPNKENTSDILLTCLQTVAPSATEVGGDVGYSNTPCKAIQT
jgi:hypothetical protein